MADPRQDHLIRTIADVSSINPESLKALGSSNEALLQFLDDPSVTLLEAAWDGSNVRLSNAVSGEPAQQKVFISKIKPEIVTSENMHSLQVSSMIQPPLESLYAAVKQIYGPSLQAGSAGSGSLPPDVKELLTKLQASLETVVQSGSSASNFASVQKPSQEFQFWRQARNSSNITESQAAGAVVDHFDAIEGRWDRLHDLKWAEVGDLLDETMNKLEDVWKDPKINYPQARMENLLRVFTAELISFLIRSLDRVGSLWTAPYGDVRIALKEADRLCESWLGILDQLIDIFRKTPEPHQWQGSFEDTLAGPFHKRIEQVLKIRNTHEELLRMLSPAERSQLRMDSVFLCFDNVHPLRIDPYSEAEWEKAKAAFDEALSPAERSVASKLQAEIAKLTDRPVQLLREFDRFRNLFGRPTIAKQLVKERETLLAQLSGMVDAMEAKLETRMNEMGTSSAPYAPGLSPTLDKVVWGHSLRAKVAGVLQGAKRLLGNLHNFSEFNSACKETLDRLQAWLRELFQAWKSEMRDALEEQELGLEMTGQLMEFDVAGNMIVNYSDRLVVLLREVRQFTELGYTVPPEIANAASEAEKYYRHGVMLKKIANFYNTLGSQLIPTQKPLLLGPLEAFEAAVQERSGGRGGKVTWKNPEECQAYVDRLQDAAEKLSSENRRLHRIHAQIGRDVTELMNIDLLRNRDKWRSHWNSLQQFVSEMTRPYEQPRLYNWLLFWDHQLYKALEINYKMGLESLNENLNEIKCELIFSNRQLQFRPPIEELRLGYYKEMKHFIATPANFPGFQSQAVFQRMAEKNAPSLVQVYRKAEILFARLTKLQEKLEDWVALGKVDLEKFVATHVTTVADYEVNFKMLKAKRKESEKLPDFYKIDCVTVSATPFRAAVEDHMQRLSDTLVFSLRRRVTDLLNSLEEYLNGAMEKLSQRPKSIEEIAEAKTAWKELAEEKGNKRNEYKECEDLKRLLLSVAGSSVSVVDITQRLAALPAAWENFEISMDAFDDMMEEERKEIMGRVDDEIIQVNQNIEKFASRWQALKPTEVQDWSEKGIEQVFQQLEEWKARLAEVSKEAERLVTNCESFGMPTPKFDTLPALEEDVKSVEENWLKMKDYQAQRNELAEQDWIGFRTHLYDLQDFADKWMAETKGQTKDAVAMRIKTEADEIRKAMPGLKFCRGDPFKDEHWSQCFRKLGIPKDVRLSNLKVGHFLDVLPAVANNVKFLKDLQSRAQGEFTIREALQELMAWSETAEFSLFEHNSEATGRKTMLIKDWKELFAEVGDNQSLLQSLKESQYFRAFADTATQFEKRLATLDQASQTLNSIQRKWVYLEPIFGRGALPEKRQQERFNFVDTEFRDVMGQVERDPRIFSLADEALFPNLVERLNRALDQLERCQKALSKFLEEKRSKMPRFYFIGDDDLLEILGQAKNPLVIQAHLKKLFQGVHRVKFSEDNKSIIAMCSVAGEEVPLSQPVSVDDEVETWLNALAKEMCTTLQKLLVQCVKSHDERAMEIFPSQILCLAEQISFNEQVEGALARGGGAALQQVREHLAAQLQGYTGQDLSKEPLLQLKVKALVLDIVHNMDVVDMLIAESVTSPSAWQWQKQLRFRLNSKGICMATMCDAVTPYTYEYQGNAPKLVHTPLTDKCYLTLTQGMHMGYGGNPYGPAGTGKTESVKALGAALGRQVLVFNCDEGIDFQSMGRIFTGLVLCGAWGCFDEFNRLKEDQLSAVSQQIQVIQAAIKEGAATVELLGKTIQVNSNAGIFVTMNPAGKGYGGRSKLPDNLKQLFRPVAMSIPDSGLIAEVILYSEGFVSAKDLGRKMVSLFNLSKQLLTPQQHYDWGLRAMKSCLNTGGKLIQQYKRAGHDITPNTEQELLIQAVRVNTLSKLTFEDSTRFLGLIQDVFPGAESSDISSETLEANIRSVMVEEFGLLVDESQIRKMIQLKESLDQRMGCVIVGPSGCGKTALWRVLRSAMEKGGQRVVVHVMNPKSMPRSRLLGEMDPDTRDWMDGVLTAAARQVVKEPLEVRSWIVCDGDVDPEWIESLNSVLDDNHLLTLPNGERINFGSNVNFLFETHDLQFASPATISRMGMIYLSDEDVDVRRIVKCWLARQPKELQADLENWLDELFYKALEWVLKENAFVVDTTMVGTVLNGLSHVQDATAREEFVMGIIYGLGGNLTAATRTTFAKEVFTWAGIRPPDISAPLNVEADGSSLIPLKNEDVGDCERSDIEKGRVIMTVSMQRTAKLIERWIERMEPFVLVGPEGCGKSCLIKSLIRQRRNTSVATLHCNAQTTAEHVILKIRQSCSLFSTNSGKVYRPREGDRLVLFLKDINLPQPDKYNTCPLIAFLQQLVTFNGFYDENLEFLGLERVHIVSTMNPSTTVGRHNLSTRFTAIVRLGYMEYPDTTELSYIYRAYAQGALGSVTTLDARARSGEFMQRIADTMVSVYEQIKAKFTVDDHRHYLFTPRDLTSWVQGLLRYRLESADALVEVLAHEAQRIFGDRLVGPDAHTSFDGILNSVLRSRWGFKGNSANSDYYVALAHGGGSSGAAGGGAGGGARAGGSGGEDQGLEDGKQAALLERVKEDELRALVERGLMMYEREEKELHIQLFREVLDHIAQVDRVLSEEGGSLLLVGHSGVGRRSATTLVAHMHGMELYTPAITRSYGAKQFFGDIKGVLQKAGVAGEEVVLYIEDHQFTENSILETVNSLLSSGEVPGLYSHEELESILSPLKELMSESGVGFRTPYEFFVSRIRANLHVVLGMDPHHPEFLVRCESNPALYTRCTILWMGEWRTASMKALPAMLIPDLLERTRDPEEFVSQLVAVHQSAKRVAMATPRDFISFLKTYRFLYEQKVGGLEKETSHLAKGLGKLREAERVVDELSTQAAKQQEELQQSQRAVEEALEDVSNAMVMATERKKTVKELQSTLAVKEAEIQKEKDSIEEELSGITPILEEAKKAVGSIDKQSLNEMRSLSSPPPALIDVLSGVLMLLGNQDTSWNSMRKFLGQRGVIQDILAFDSRRISPSIQSAVMKTLKEKASSFEHKTIARASVAAAPLAAWVKANVRYSMVLKKIAPLEESFSKATQELQSSQAQLRENEEELAKIDVKIKELKAESSRKAQQAESLKLSLVKTEETLQRAQALLEGLGGEKGRWERQHAMLENTVKTLPAQILVAAGFVTYLAKATEDMRADAIAEWEAITGLQKFDVLRLLSSESTMLTWKSEGLPADQLSMENALVILSSEHSVPFIVDPSTSATQWLKNHLGKAGSVETITPANPKFQTEVELAVRFGKTLVISEVDGIEPMLYPLVRRDLRLDGMRQVVRIGDKEVDYNEKFKLYLSTRNPDPQLPPDAASLVNEVNFTVTKSGLEGQLLGVTLQHEQPELEQKKSELLAKEEDMKVQLAAVEKELLEVLATSEGNILENQALIDTLRKAKQKAGDIEASLEGAAKASEELDRQREAYRPFAAAGSRFFFLIRALQNRNHMYQFSLNFFITLFKETLANKYQDASSVAQRIERLIPQLQTTVLYSVGQSLFKEDRLMYAMHLVHGSHPEMFEKNEWEFFLGDLVPDLSDTIPQGFPQWAPPEQAPLFKLMQSTFPTLVASLGLQSGDSWQRWAQSTAPERDFPSSCRGISAFQRVLVVQVLRPDRLLSAMQAFVCEAMHVNSVAPPAASLQHLLEESGPHTPVLMVTTTGADPSRDLQEFAYTKVGRDKYFEVAMGGGQQEIALTTLRQCAANGHWLCLKNLHLVTAWLPTLEKELNILSPENGFRLWLTTESHPNFPTILLQESIKVTYEAPPGIKKNLERTYEAWNEEYLAQGSQLRGAMLFVLAWFHAVVQERRTFVPQGWTKAYEFSFADLRAGSNLVDAVLSGRMTRGGSGGGGGGGGANAITSAREVPWQFIYGLMENAIYGGRVDNVFDFRVLQAYLRRYFNPEVLSGSSQAGSHLLPGLALPFTNSKSEFLAQVANLPDSDSPKLFGLPENIERSVQRATSRAVIAQLKNLIVSTEASGTFNKERWRESLGPVLDLWDKLSSNIKHLLKEVPRSLSTEEAADPIVSFIEMERSLGLRIVQRVHADLTALKKVLYGSGLLTPAIARDGAALMKDEIPSAWEKLWEGPEAPKVWLAAVVRRSVEIEKWVAHAKNGSLLKSPMNLGHLFRPGTFLNAFRQQTARTTRSSMETLKLVSCWDRSLLGSAGIVVTLEGLMLQGAAFDGSSLRPPAPNAPDLIPAPPVHIAWISQKEPNPYGPGSFIPTPVYHNIDRSKLFTEVALPCSGDTSAWVLAGVALFLDTK